MTNCDVLQEHTGVQFTPVFLTEDDVPDAHLPHPDIGINTKKLLQRWLRLRDVLTGGTKKDLVEKYV